ncbi:hypothetical protein KATP_04640 [Kluyvera ascorbata]|nr:hypothetical protein KATP_04640 [Kluyvera ascorbata]
MRYADPVKYMSCKGVNGGIGVCDAQPVAKKYIRGVEKITGTIDLARGSY